MVCDVRLVGVLLAAAVAVAPVSASEVGPLVGEQGAQVTSSCDVVAANPAGTVEVLSGTATFVTNAALLSVELPTGLQEGLVLWLDANRNTIWGSNLTEAGTTEEGVVEWRDVRETGTDSATFAYPRAVVYQQPDENFRDYRSTPPTYSEDAQFAGKKMIDFGEFGSKKWLYTAGRDGSLYRVPCRSFFIVGGLRATQGHILADMVNNEVGKGTMFYHKQQGSTGDGKLASSDLNTCVMSLGETRFNGELIQATDFVLPRNSFWMLSQNGPGVVSRGDVPTEPFFSTFFNQMNYTKRRDYQDRQGGGILGEVLVYDRVLSNDERKQVEAYLNAKWFGRITLGTVKVASGAEAVVSSKQTSIQAKAVEGTGSFVNSNSASGKLMIDDDYGLNEASYGLSSNGSISFESRRSATYLKAAANSTYIIRPQIGTINRGAPKPGIFRIIGALDENPVYIDPESIHGLHVQATNATVILAPHAAIAAEPQSEETPSWAGTNLIVNGGFEAQQFGSTSSDSLNKAVSRWTVSGDTVYAYAAAYASVWYQGGGSYVAQNHFGNNVGALQGNAEGTVTISQTIVPPVTGVYRLSYYLSRRQSRKDNGDNSAVLKVSLDGVAFHRNSVFEDHLINRNEMNPYSTLTPVLEKDREYTISFSIDDNSTVDRAVILDEICLTPEYVGDDRVFIPGYDLLSLRGEIKYNSTLGGYFSFDPAGTFWEKDLPDGGEGDFGFTSDSVWWSFRDSRSGEEDLDARGIFLQKDAAVRNSVYFPKAGRVRFSVRFANRSTSYPLGTTFDSEFRPKGHILEVSVGGKVIGSVPVMRATKSVAEFEFDVAEAGNQELRIACVRPSALSTKDVAVIFDHPAMEYIAGDTTLAAGNTVDLTVTAPSNGFYAISLPLGGPKSQPMVTNGVLNTYRYYPAVASLSVDGEDLAQIRSLNDTMGPYEFRLPYLTAGSHVLTIRADDVKSMASIRYRAPELKPLELAAFASDGTDDGASKTVIELEAGSKLDLRYPGTYRVSKLYRNGVSVRGEVSSATYPEWVTGPGVIEVQSKGMMIIFR